MLKVLIVSYYWPPSGGGGVQRWVKMSKYFKEFGWDPIVFIPENPEYPIVDRSFDDEVKDIPVIKGKIWEPSRFLRKMGAGKEANLSSGFVSDKPSLGQKLAIAIRGNFFIPDARKFWIKPSVKTLSTYLDSHKVDVIISTGPPHSAHLIAFKLKEKFKLPWIADFRDPWTNIDFYKDLKLRAWADAKHRRLEKAVLNSADVVVTIGKTMGSEMKTLGAKTTEVITNGFDLQINCQKLDQQFTITHMGRLGKSRNPELLWKVLAELTQENDEFAKCCKIQLIGNVDGEIKISVIKNGVTEYVDFGNSVSNQESLNVQSRSQMLLLLINDTPNSKGILTGKFFEYISVKRPIIAIGPLDGDAAEILTKTASGQMFSYTQHKQLKKHLLGSFEKFKENRLEINSTGIEEYSRKNLAKKYTELLNTLVSE
ncbi:MAG: glycosyltransferase involved in cell wall biosynthesis [Glaciecola sp.]|jgi:glycosyltransferase involved in cell wall biosynthesis